MSERETCPSVRTTDSTRAHLHRALHAYRSLPTAHCPRPTAHCPRPTAHGPLPTAHCPRPTAHGLIYSYLHTRTSCQERRKRQSSRRRRRRKEPQREKGVGGVKKSKEFPLLATRRTFFCEKQRGKALQRTPKSKTEMRRARPGLKGANGHRILKSPRKALKSTNGNRSLKSPRKANKEREEKATRPSPLVPPRSSVLSRWIASCYCTINAAAAASQSAPERLCFGRTIAVCWPLHGLELGWCRA